MLRPQIHIANLLLVLSANGPKLVQFQRWPNESSPSLVWYIPGVLGEFFPLDRTLSCDHIFSTVVHAVILLERTVMYDH